VSSSGRTVVDVELDASPDVVWRALREPSEIRRWFGWEYPGLDQEIASIFLSGAEVAEAGRTLRIIGADTTLTVLPSPGGAGLQITMPPTAQPPAYDEIEEGWMAFAHQLRLALQKHPGQDGRRMHHRAPLRGPEAASADTIPGPEPLSGSPWFQNQHQRAWLIPSWGDGLLILNRSPSTADAPLGTRSVLITAYGMSPPAFEDLRSRWIAWNTGGAR
jgi:hypothetical protein